MKKDIPKRKVPFFCILKGLSNTQQILSCHMYFNLKFCITNNNTGLFVEKALPEREKFQYFLICFFFQNHNKTLRPQPNHSILMYSLSSTWNNTAIIIKSFKNVEFLSVECCAPYLATRHCFGKKFPAKWALELLRSVNSNIRGRLLFPIRRIHQQGNVLLRRRRIQDRKVLWICLDSSDYPAW